MSKQLAMVNKSETKQTASYEKSVAELERIIREMESEDISLENALKLYQRGVDLLKGCHKQISEVQQKVELLDKETLKIFPSD